MNNTEFKNEGVKTFFDNFITSNNTPQNQSKNNNDDDYNRLEVLIKNFYNTENMELKADIKENEIIIFALAQEYAQIFHQPIVSDLVNKIFKISVSKNRGGRKEFENIFKFAREEQIAQDGGFGRFRGLMGGLMD